jgi:hypothetical protein
VLLQVQHCFLQLLQLHLHGGAVADLLKPSLMFLVSHVFISNPVSAK